MTTKSNNKKPSVASSNVNNLHKPRHQRLSHIFIANVYGKLLWQKFMQIFMANFYGKRLWQTLIRKIVFPRLRCRFQNIPRRLRKHWKLWASEKRNEILLESHSALIMKTDYRLCVFMHCFSDHKISTQLNLNWKSQERAVGYRVA